jgi:hypothetical protein
MHIGPTRKTCSIKKIAVFCLLVRSHRCVRNRHTKSDRPQKEGAWLNQTYWPITYNKIWYIKKNALLQKTCDMCSLARHQKPKNVCYINSFCQIQIVLKSCDSQEMETIGTRVPSFRNCWFASVRTNASQSWKHMFLVLGTSGSQTL